MFGRDTWQELQKEKYVLLGNIKFIFQTNNIEKIYPWSVL